MGRPANSVAKLRETSVAEQSNGCWQWTGGIATNGYSKTRIADKHMSGHRAFYTFYRGPIAAGMTIDHLCRNKACVNPDHLEVVTQRENNRRADNIPARNARKTHCIREHPLSGENLYVTPEGRRQCRICRRQTVRRYQQGRV